MDKENKIILAVTVVVIIGIIAFIFAKNTDNIVSNKYDEFAKCITEKEAVMYGAESCSHCKAQKAVLGDSFKYINYIECPDNINFCLERGIEGYPTWLIGTSTKIEGFDKNTTMQEISDATSCPLPKQ
ncbi:MAG: hypothetical protein PHN69_00380 [Candidatus Pacebacteria bacterium]|nr:hypothetical protein [Candidatus Paceibacterota bacterium]